jgi:1-acyl-sn-glycerol-3-phosphate acyltransferase
MTNRETPPPDAAPRGRSLLNRFLYAVMWCVCWAFTKLLFRFRATGRSNVPMEGPVLLVSNHQSHLDPVLIGVAAPRPTGALARKSLFFWPLSWLIRTLGAVPVDLEGSAVSGIKAILGMLRANEAVIVFPEGTRTYDGQLQPLLPGFCAIARRAKATIVPTSIDGAFTALPRGKVLPRLRPIRLTFGTPITPAEIAEKSDDALLEIIAGQIAAGISTNPANGLDQ